MSASSKSVTVAITITAILIVAVFAAISLDALGAVTLLMLIPIGVLAQLNVSLINQTNQLAKNADYANSVFRAAIEQDVAEYVRLTPYGDGVVAGYAFNDLSLELHLPEQPEKPIELRFAGTEITVTREKLQAILLNK